MKRFQSILAAALAGCLLMAFTACSSGNNGGTATNPPTGVNTSEASETKKDSTGAGSEKDQQQFNSTGQRGYQRHDSSD